MTQTENQTALASTIRLDEAIAALKKDYASLAPRIRSIEHSITCECNNVKLHMYYPAICQGKTTIFDLVEVLYHYLAPFSLPRTQVEHLNKQYGQITAEDFKRKHTELLEEAKRLFIKANKATNKNGEAGELLLYILTEWVLQAPQLVAKMSLKTNRSMAIHGSDGIHINYSKANKRLVFYWGESKLYADVKSGISSAIESIKTALEPEKIKHELDIVKRNIDFSGIDEESKSALLSYLDPFEEFSNEKESVPTCLVGFNFESYTKGLKAGEILDEVTFNEIAIKKLTELADTVSTEIKNQSIPPIPIEFFLFPIPCVKNFEIFFKIKSAGGISAAPLRKSME